MSISNKWTAGSHPSPFFFPHLSLYTQTSLNNKLDIVLRLLNSHTSTISPSNTAAPATSASLSSSGTATAVRGPGRRGSRSNVEGIIGNADASGGDEHTNPLHSSTS